MGGNAPRYGFVYDLDSQQPAATDDQRQGGFQFVVPRRTDTPEAAAAAACGRGAPVRLLAPSVPGAAGHGPAAPTTLTASQIQRIEVNKAAAQRRRSASLARSAQPPLLPHQQPDDDVLMVTLAEQVEEQHFEQQRQTLLLQQQQQQQHKHQHGHQPLRQHQEHHHQQQLQQQQREQQELVQLRHEVKSLEAQLAVRDDQMQKLHERLVEAQRAPSDPRPIARPSASRANGGGGGGSGGVAGRVVGGSEPELAAGVDAVACGDEHAPRVILHEEPAEFRGLELPYLFSNAHFCNAKTSEQRYPINVAVSRAESAVDDTAVEVHVLSYTKEKCLQLAAKARKGAALGEQQLVVLRRHRALHAEAEKARAQHAKRVRRDAPGGSEGGGE
eukprot:Tamp_15896.p1 GENE.Tamp_15896~~Tamp_15896.p1  ORF type:complete len:427 (-),score=107.93 Tamp_15896:227-1387(-)